MKYLYFLIFGSLALFSMSASAIPIIYTMTGEATGRLGTTRFTNADYTITCLADTSQIMTSGAFLSVLDTSATISIAGVGTATIIVPFYTYDNQTNSQAGFYYISDYNSAAQGLGVMNTAFSTYGLASAIGPLGGPSTAKSGIGINTTAGSFDPLPLSLSTFQASTDIPDQGPSLCLLGLGLLALVGFHRGIGKIMTKVDSKSGLRLSTITKR